MELTPPSQYRMSLTAAEVEELLLSVYTKIPLDIIRTSLENPSDETIPTTKAVADALGLITGDLEYLGDLSLLDVLDLGSSKAVGVLPISKGGTGGGTVELAQQNLGIVVETAIQAMIDASIPEIQSVDLGSSQATGVLPLSKGGTGATGSSQARANLQVWSSDQSEALALNTFAALKRSYAEAGYTLVPGSFEDGGVVSSTSEVLLYKAEGLAYGWTGTIPVGGKVVPAGSTPTTAGGIGVGAWTSQYSALLRNQLAAVDGANMVGAMSYSDLRAYNGNAVVVSVYGRVDKLDGAEGRFALDVGDTATADNDGTVLVDAAGRRWKRNYSIVDMRWFGIVGGGIVDNATSFQKADALGKNLLINGSDTYLTTYEPLSRVYTNAAAKMKIGGVTITLSQVPLQITAIEQEEFDDTKVRLSNTLVGIDAAPNLLSNGNSYGNTAYGTGAMQNAVEAKRVTAIGPFAVRDPVIAYSVTGIGTTSLEWMVYGDRLTFVGDNSGKNLGNPTPVGRHAYFDPANPNPNDWDTRWPAWRAYAGAVNAPAQVMSAGDFGNKATHMVGVGRNAFGFSLTAKDSVALGYDGGTSLLYGQDNVFVGDRAGQWTIKANFTTAVGSKVMRYLMDSDQDTAVGNSAMFNYVHSSRNVAMGYQALAGFQCNLTDVPLSNVAIGRISMANCVGNVSFNVAIGEGTLAACHSNENTALGTSALGYLADAVKGRNTAVGRSALLTMQDGSNATSLLQCTGIGWGARVSGDDQVQLGGSTSTTYVYGTVQNRSDANDKTGVRNTVLGIEYILGLRPVDYRWDMRDDYIQSLPETPVKPTPPIKSIAPIREAGSEGVRVYHLDGDESNIYSRVIETGGSDYVESDEQYQKRFEAYQIDLEQYESDLILWETACSQIREYNATVLAGEGKDGSKARTRYHHGFIAQEVKALTDKLGVDFGGYQDHKINGGCDVLSIGYDEFIAPAVKAIQQCWERMDEIEARLDKAGL